MASIMFLLHMASFESAFNRATLLMASTTGENVHEDELHKMLGGVELDAITPGHAPLVEHLYRRYTTILVHGASIMHPFTTAQHIGLLIERFPDLIPDFYSFLSKLIGHDDDIVLGGSVLTRALSFELGDGILARIVRQKSFGAW